MYCCNLENNIADAYFVIDEICDVGFFCVCFKGGVTSMDSFLKKFFPSVYEKESNLKPSANQYCKFNSQILTLFTSSLYLSALIAGLGASSITRMLGRRATMILGGIFFVAGALLNGFAISIWMLIVGRLLLGFGIGCANQVYPFLWTLIFMLVKRSHIIDQWEIMPRVNFRTTMLKS